MFFVKKNNDYSDLNQWFYGSVRNLNRVKLNHINAAIFCTGLRFGLRKYFLNEC